MNKEFGIAQRLIQCLQEESRVSKRFLEEVVAEFSRTQQRFDGERVIAGGCGRRWFGEHGKIELVKKMRGQQHEGVHE